jgi:cytochrome c oxidase subunit 2
MTAVPEASLPDPGSAAASGAGTTGGGGHVRKIVLTWLVLTVIADPLFVLLAGPHLPPGAMTLNARSQQIDFTVVTATAIPVILAVWVYFAYALIVWRQPKGEPITDGPPLRSNFRVQAGFIATTTVIVLAMFIYGTIELIGPAGAGGGEGPAPIWTPSAKNVLVIQVIAQQWKFTYRYPSFGGFEVDDLVIPSDTAIAFHVTSLDVIHDFWAYQLGVKADANPGSDNVAFTTTGSQTGGFIVRCAELCGLWHGAMYTNGLVLTKTGFENWATSTESKQAPATALLPKFAWTYTPDANGSDGGYYPDNKDPYSSVETETFGS